MFCSSRCTGFAHFVKFIMFFDAFVRFVCFNLASGLILPILRKAMGYDELQQNQADWEGLDWNG